MKKKILIIGGGISKEKLISIETAKAVYKELKKKNYNVILCEPDNNLINRIKLFKPDVVFNALHGQFGEDGYIQAVLESLKVKYTHSGVLASSIAMDKILSKEIYIKNKILTPKYLKFKFSKHLINKKLIIKIDKEFKFPVVVKPINEGSSVNVFICNKKNFIKNLKKLSFYKEVLIEKFILGKKKLGAIELVPKRKFYDYEAKYNVKAKTKHIIPVDLSKKNLEKILQIAQKAHNIIGCKGVTRSDFKFYKNKFYLLETNTQPGMTKLSLVPEIATYNGMNFIGLIEWILKDASRNR